MMINDSAPETSAAGEFPSGLSNDEVLAQQAAEGFNELTGEGGRSLAKIAAEVARDPMFLLLLVAGGIYLLAGDAHEALILLAFVGVIMGVTIGQSRRTERALELLRELSSPRALVVRDGRAQRIPGREVVREDVLMLSEGDRVPADGIVLSAHELAIDESLLTGESLPAEKGVPPPGAKCETAAGPSRVFAGTLVIRGQGLIRVSAIGAATELGRIGESVATIGGEASPLQREIQAFTRRLAVVGIGLCVVVAALYALLRGGWLDGLLAGITLAMGILPQEFPVILIVFLALGARRLARAKVLTRRLPAIETLGETTVLCVDKTGTLIRNRMAVAALSAGGCRLRIEEGTVSQTCRKARMFAEAAAMADEGLRVLGVAKAQHRGKAFPAIQHDFDFEFVGLIGLADPLRPEVPPAIAECREAGIRVVMITGDHPHTARAIAACAGIDTPRVATASELESLAPRDLATHLRSNSVFARVTPAQKLRIVEALKADGEVVAMTGDGVNDAPALKAAHIGIAMGKRGTDVAREAADRVLLEDDFTAIVDAIRLGRRIFANLRQAMIYTFAVHVPIIGLAFLPLLFGLPLVLAPIHIAFLELLIDPACSVAFEAERAGPGLMHQPPRRLGEPLVATRHISLGLVQGAMTTLVVVGLYGYSIEAGAAADAARSMAFIALVVANCALIFASRKAASGIRNAFREVPVVSYRIVAGALVALAAVTALPVLAAPFSFGILTPSQWLGAAGLGALSLLLFEATKRGGAILARALRLCCKQRLPRETGHGNSVPRRHRHRDRLEIPGDGRGQEGAGRLRPVPVGLRLALAAALLKAPCALLARSCA